MYSKFPGHLFRVFAALLLALTTAFGASLYILTKLGTAPIAVPLAFTIYAFASTLLALGVVVLIFLSLLAVIHVKN